jgi:chitin synthase
MLIYLISLPIWNFVLPTYAYWKFDDFSWGDTRKTAGEKVKKAGIEYEGEFDSSKITMKRWGDFEQGKHFRPPSTGVSRLTCPLPERRLRASHANAGWTQQAGSHASFYGSKGGY